ncbi:MAG: MBL fold metallo-hydrolase [Mollicutes bacterium]|nr:MBL fold metallo-hydrolase [Mollicutes bacterium]
MKITVLASGSKGNATYLETSKTKILIDAGISMLQIKSRLKNEGIELTKLDAVFVSHEHTDHVLHLSSVLSRTNATLYIDEISYNVINKKTNNSLLPFKTVFLKNDYKYSFEDIFVVPIQLSHDSASIHGFLFKELNEEKNLSFASITDTGIIPEKYFPILRSINVLMIESNHDVEMLMTSRRPWPLIQRILAKTGHLSNETCVDYLTKIISNNTKHIILAHLSEECNEPQIAINECYKVFGENLKFSLVVAEQYQALPTIEVE